MFGISFNKKVEKVVEKIKSSFSRSIKLDLDKDLEAKLLDFSVVRSAIESGELNKLMGIYQKILNADLNLSGSLQNRKNALLALPYEIDAGDKEMQILTSMLEGGFGFDKFLNAIHNDIYYGISLQNIIYEVKDGLVLPVRHKTIMPTSLSEDTTKEKLYFQNKDNKKLYIHSIDTNRLIIHTHEIDNSRLATNSIAYKLLWTSILKHTIITLNLEFIDKAAVPPLIVKINDLNDTKKADELFGQMMELKSTSVGMFTKDIEIETLKMESKVQFDTTIKYLDQKQNEFLVGGNLSGSSDGKVGSQSLGNVHENRLMEVVKADSKLINETVTRFFNQVLSLNLASFTPVKFSFTLPEQKNHEELKVKSETIANLTTAGYVVPLKHIEKTFSMEGVTFKPQAQSNNSIEFNKTSSATSPEVEIKRLEDEILEILSPLIESCNSYDELLDKLHKEFSFMDFEKLEEILTKDSLVASLKGSVEVGNDAKD
jgi:phage gp29-like protein